MGWRLSEAVRRTGVAALLTLLLAGLPAWWLSRPPAAPTITVSNANGRGLVIVTDSAGRRLVLGGSAGRTAASAALDRQLPPWDRRVDLLLVTPPLAGQLPGALGVLDRWPVARASLLGLADRPGPEIDAWQARHPAAPVVGQAMVALADGARLWLDSGDETTGEAALAVLERGSVRLLLLCGAADELAMARLASGQLAPPTAIVRLTPASAGSLAAWSVPLVVTIERQPTLGQWPGQIALAPGDNLRLTLEPDRLRIVASGR